MFGISDVIRKQTLDIYKLALISDRYDKHPFFWSGVYENQTFNYTTKPVFFCTKISSPFFLASCFYEVDIPGLLRCFLLLLNTSCVEHKRCFNLFVRVAVKNAKALSAQLHT